MLNVAAWIEHYGYIALATGSLLEGETILIAAGFAAHRGYLDLYKVMAIAAVCGFIGDQFFFWLGRRHGSAIVNRWPSVLQQTERVHRLIERFHAPVIIGIRFAYGLRIAGPILIGMSAISSTRFALFNGIGAALWAVLIASIGWAFGQAASVWLGQIEQMEGWLLLGLFALAALWWWVRKHSAR